MRTLICAFVACASAAVALVVNERPASAWEQCDFLTGGGWIIQNEAKANFSIAGSCRPGGNGHGLWGHLQYIDHGTSLNVHWETITAYGFFAQFDPDPQTGQPHGSRIICGTARTNQYDDVDFAVKADDNSEPGVTDVFILRLEKDGAEVYSTRFSSGPTDDDTLGGTGEGGGDVQLHKPNPSITGAFSELSSANCPAFD